VSSKSSIRAFVLKKKVFEGGEELHEVLRGEGALAIQNGWSYVIVLQYYKERSVELRKEKRYEEVTMAVGTFSFHNHADWLDTGMLSHYRCSSYCKRTSTRTVRVRVRVTPLLGSPRRTLKIFNWFPIAY